MGCLTSKKEKKANKDINADAKNKTAATTKSSQPQKNQNSKQSPKTAPSVTTKEQAQQNYNELVNKLVNKLQATKQTKQKEEQLKIINLIVSGKHQQLKKLWDESKDHRYITLRTVGDKQCGPLDVAIVAKQWEIVDLLNSYIQVNKPCRINKNPENVLQGLAQQLIKQDILSGSPKSNYSVQADQQTKNILENIIPNVNAQKNSLDNNPLLKVLGPILQK